VPFFRHGLGSSEAAAVAGVLGGRVLTTGDQVERFERAFADYLGRRHAIALTSCTAAIQLSLTALGVQPGDEVITTPMSFLATATAIMQAGARPVFVDVEPDTGNIDAARIADAVTARTRAVVPVHLYGQMCDMVAIGEIAESHGLVVVEDAAHCVEGTRDGMRPGDAGRSACFSFYATKSLTCGEGGAVVTDDDDLAHQLRLLRLHGLDQPLLERMRRGYRHADMVTMGWKYNMDDIHAALLNPQVAGIDERRAQRSGLAARYMEALARVDGVRWPTTRTGSLHARHLFPIWVDGRDQVVEGLLGAGIEVVVNYRALHRLGHLARVLGHRADDFPIADWIGERTLSLPLYPTMPSTDVDLVAEAVASVVPRVHDGSVHAPVDAPYSG
jgi:UDP-4-amino-4-deoxy-L-arabinose-oxoglutarate aminotransferase